MNINGRIRKLRKDLQLNQKAFGEKIALGQAAISWIEQEGNGVTEQNIKAICTAFNVSEEWIREGKGEIFLSNRETLIDRLKKELSLNDTEIAILNIYTELPREDRDAILRFAENVSNIFQSTSQRPSAPAMPTPEDYAAYNRVMAFEGKPYGIYADTLTEAEWEAVRKFRLEKEALSSDAG